MISHKMHHLLKAMRIFAWSRYLQKLVSAGAIRRSIFNFFANQNFSRHRKTELLRKWIALVLQAKFCFMDCLVKANALVLGNIALLIVLVITKQPSVERCLANIFSPVFLWESKYRSKSFRKFTKIHLWWSFMLVKLQAFTAATTGCVL